MDLIDRNEIRWVIVPITDESGTTAKFLVAFEDEVDALPSVDAAPRVRIHAHWKENKNGTHSCSNCEGEALIDAWELRTRGEVRESLSDYCPNCAAIMDEEMDGEE